MPTKAKAAPVEPEELEEPIEDMVYLDADDGLESVEPEELEAAEELETLGTFERLSGQELLDFYAAKKAEGFSHSDIAYKAGYYTVTQGGQERTMTAQFNEAMLLAQGIEIGGKPAAAGRSHAGMSKARVSGQGILLVSQLATRAVGAEPGAVFSVEYPTGEFAGPGAQILLTLTDEFKPVVTRKPKGEAKEEPGTPLLDQAD
jgi:hypothetical protein